MIGPARRWLRRNRRGLAIGAGVVGIGYLAGQYVLSKISETRERISSDWIAKENLRRRFEQNQTDCSYTVLALLPTAAEHIIEALPVEELTKELQRKRAERLARINAGESVSSEKSSVGPSVAPSLMEDDRRSVASEGFVHASQMVEPRADGDDPPKPKRSKAQLWNEVKISSITRSFTLIYVLSLLNIFTRIQLNLLGRRNYLSSVISLATPPENESVISLEDHDDDNPIYALGNDSDTNRRYLAFSWWLLHRGWKQLMGEIRAAVTEAFGPLNPREDISLSRLSELTVQIRKRIEGSTERERRSRKWLPYLLPPHEAEQSLLEESGVIGAADPPSSAQAASTLRYLLDETADLVDSPSFTHVFTLLNNEGFATLVERNCAQNAFKSGSSPQAFASLAVGDTMEAKTKLANVLAAMTRQAHIIGNGANPPNEYLTAMDQGVRELEAFAAVVYSSNFNANIIGSGQRTPSSQPQPHPQPLLLMPDTDASSFDPIIIAKEEPQVVHIGDDNDNANPSLDDSSGIITEPAVVAIAREEGEQPVFEEVWGKAAIEDKALGEQGA